MRDLILRFFRPTFRRPLPRRRLAIWPPQILCFAVLVYYFDSTDQETFSGLIDY
jgi:hypothetical protein